MERCRNRLEWFHCHGTGGLNRSLENADIPVLSCLEDYLGCALTPSDIEDEENPGLEPEFSPRLYL